MRSRCLRCCTRSVLWAGLAALVCALASGVTRAQVAGMLSTPLSEPPPLEPYALDSVSRSVTAHDPLSCDERRLVPYRGQVIEFTREARVDRAFRPHLIAFERIVQELGKSLYGRPPHRIKHLGAFACRRIRGLPMWVSEHALGNAIDVAGFEFGPARGATPPHVPAELKAPFNVTVLEHWQAKGAADVRLHARFLRQLAERLTARPDVFRVLIGPRAGRHRNHFHFDMGQARNVAL